MPHVFFFLSVSVYVHARECFLAYVFVQEGKEAKKDEDVEKAEGKAVQSLFLLLVAVAVWEKVLNNFFRT